MQLLQQPPRSETVWSWELCCVTLALVTRAQLCTVQSAAAHSTTANWVRPKGACKRVLHADVLHAQPPLQLRPDNMPDLGHCELCGHTQRSLCQLLQLLPHTRLSWTR
jgi:hypothetical protein